MSPVLLIVIGIILGWIIRGLMEAFVKMKKTKS
jgi:uncharacterized membrane protein YciS (DUF1049 family)